MRDQRRSRASAGGTRAQAKGTRFRAAGSAAHRTGGKVPAGRAAQPARAHARADRARGPRRSHGVRGIVLVLIVLAAAAALVVFVAVPALTGPGGPFEIDTVEDGQPVEVSIPDGSSGDDIARILSENHVVDNPRDYYAAVEAANAASQIQPGDYAFTTHMDPAAVVAQLVEGPNVDGSRFTVAEGLTVAQTADAVEKALGIPADEFTAQAVASNYADDYPFLAGVANDSLEGYLTPKTYTFDSSTEVTADTVIRAMLDQYEVEVSGLDFASAEAALKSRYGVEMSDYQIVIMASIIEREAITAEQRPLVASTFYNRLHQGMALQSDATMMYVTGGEVTAEDLEQESPYNTYLNKGLPPTPICTPSPDSLKAALEPADTNYLYFFITQDDEYFSETYDQHLQAIEENR